eukprot:COSAG02_NODE_2502_length_8672_cov_3.830631_2_plen_116_part_00
MREWMFRHCINKSKYQAAGDGDHKKAAEKAAELHHEEIKTLESKSKRLLIINPPEPEPDSKDGDSTIVPPGSEEIRPDEQPLLIINPPEPEPDSKDGDSTIVPPGSEEIRPAEQP